MTPAVNHQARVTKLHQCRMLDNGFCLTEGRQSMATIVMKTLPYESRDRGIEIAVAYRDAGVTDLVHTQNYSNPAEY